jgi:hypothetical protein
MLIDDAGNMVSPGFGRSCLIYDKMTPGLVLDVENADFWDAVAQWFNIKLAFTTRLLILFSFILRHKRVYLPSIKDNLISTGNRILPNIASMIHPISNDFQFIRLICIYVIL